MSHIFARSVVFILLCCLGLHGGVLKPKRVVSFSNFCGLVFVRYTCLELKLYEMKCVVVAYI